MNTPDEAPKLNPWPFFGADLLLLAGAYFVAQRSGTPLAGAPLVVVGSLVFAGAVCAVIPFLLNHTRRQDAALTERQREIAALAQTLGSSAEQLGIAAGSLHAIADAAAKAVRQGEQLPQRMQEKMNEFKAQLNEVAVTENEALSQEVNTLRAAETERIESVVTTVRKLSSEFARLEAASRKNVTELADMLAKFTSSAEQAAVEAATAIASQRASAEKSLATSQTASVRAIEDTVSRALAEIDAKLASVSGQLIARLEHASAQVGTTADTTRPALTPPPVPAVSAEPPRGTDVPMAANPHAAPAEPQPSEDLQESAPSPRAATPQRDARKSHRPAPSPVEPSATSESEPQTGDAKPGRRRSARRSESDDELTLGLDLPPTEDFSQGDAESSASAVSADGMTRLLVTSYIGIGNKLYIRGEGPGLSWEKGVPLQFVSIGKWRWETGDTPGPVRAKLFKNDETECTALGEVTIEPAHQREVRAMFS